MVSEIPLQEFKELFFKIYGLNYIDGFHLFQSPLNIVKHGDFKLYDNYADEDIYVKLPILKNLFEPDEVIYIYTDHAYRRNNIFILKSKEIKEFLGNRDLDFFSNEPFFISFEKNIAFGYSLEGVELDSGIFYQLTLKHLREANEKKLINRFINILLNYCYISSSYGNRFDFQRSARRWQIGGWEPATEESQPVTADNVGLSQTRKDGLGKSKNFTPSFKSQA